MRNYSYILSVLALIVCVNVGVANTTEKDKENPTDGQEQEGRRKSDQSLIRPDADTVPEPIEEDLQEEDEVETSNSNQSVYIPTEKSDSLKEEESVSKYNFLFYFLYKFKYDGEEAP